MDDYIKRDAAKATMARFLGYGSIDEDMVCRFKVALDGIAAADVRPVVHGKWVDKGYRYRCSICGKYELYCDAVIYKFCPFCGAEMKKE